ncbi:MAG: C1 family peptidase [bacterium]|nr:C1 family peptidase [bacterium]
MSENIAATTPRGFILNAAADVPDMRDRMYEPALVELPEKIDPWEMQEREGVNLNVRSQGKEGACTGFALAAAIDLLNSRRGRGEVTVSARMLYEMAKRFDEWTGEDYEGSSLRGAIRGWWHNGVCHESDWPYKGADHPDVLSVERAKAARSNTLGAYYRLRPNLTDFHAALTEAGVLCASARVHSGWFSTKRGRIERGDTLVGGHAFAIVGYNLEGFWIQNSWGKGWGRKGIALWPYEDWAENLMDAWVFRMAVPTPVVLDLRAGVSSSDPASRAEWWFGAPRRSEIAGHFVHIDDGRFVKEGPYDTHKSDVEQTAYRVVTSPKGYKHLLFYAHGGLNSPADSAKRIRALKDVFKANGIYPYHFMYETGLVEELKDLIFQKSDRAEERVGSIFDFSDWVVEKLIRKPGTRIWNEMKDDARIAFDSGFDGLSTLETFARHLSESDIKVHLAGHSTGAILLAHLLDAMDGLPDWNRPIESCSLMAPACTVELYRTHYRDRLGSPATAPTRLRKLNIYSLTDEQERDDTVTPMYRKSLLYLVSNAFEGEDSKPLLGMQKFNRRLRRDTWPRVFYSGQGSRPHTRSKVHTGFDNDVTTMNDILKAILGPTRIVRPFTKKDLKY